MRPGTIVGDRFRLAEHAGTGGGGVVFRAEDLVERRDVAIKILHQASASQALRFRREAQVLERLLDPAIVEYIGTGLTPEKDLYLAMEWLSGETLTDRLLRGPLSVSDTARVGLRIAQALEASHALGVIHRDIKPANIFLVHGDPRATKVLDFGIARLHEGLRSEANLTAAGVMLGTLGYLSPEQARGDKIDERTDFFATGSVLFECLTGRPTFEGDRGLAILAKILLDPAPSVKALNPDVPDSLALLVDRMLSKDPGVRPQSASEVALDLRPHARASPAKPKKQVLSIVTGLSHVEQRVTSVVAVQTLVAGEGSVDHSPAQLEAVRARLSALVSRHGGRMEVLLNGFAVCAFGDQSDALIQATQAVRAAAELAELFPDSPVAVVTGRGVVDGAMPVGDAIDEAAEMITHAISPGVWLDVDTARLLPHEFPTTPSGGLFRLRSDLGSSGPQVTSGHRSPCVGRGRELAEMDRVYARCRRDGRSVVLVVTGDAGVGKTRLLSEWTVRVSADRATPSRIFALTTLSHGRGALLRDAAVVARFIESAAGIKSKDGYHEQRSKLEEAAVQALGAGPSATRTAAFFGELIGIPFPESDVPELTAARATPKVMAQRTVQAVSDWLRGLSKSGAIVLKLSDAHRADARTLRFVASLANGLSDRPVMFVITARSGELDHASLFPEAELLALGPLSFPATSDLVRFALPDATAQEVDRFVQRSGGNPFFVEELLRVSGTTGSLDLPDTVLATVQRRLDQLDARSRQVLRAASFFGPRFRLTQVHALLDDFAVADLSGCIAELVAREVLVEALGADGRGDTEYEFLSALVRDAAYATLTPADRTQGHLIAGEWLESHAEGSALDRAAHFERAGQMERAAQSLLVAAREALTSGDHEGAAQYAQRATENGARGTPKALASGVLAEALLLSGDQEAALAHAHDAAEGLPKGSREWCEVLALVVEGADSDRARQRAERAIELLSQAEVEPAARNAWARAMVRAGKALVTRRRYADATRMLDRLRGVGDKLGPHEQAMMLDVLGRIAVFEGDLFKAADQLGKAAIGYRAIAAPQLVVESLARQGWALRSIGFFEEAEKVLELAEQELETEDLPIPAAQVNESLGAVYLALGNMERADTCLRRSLLGFGEHGEMRREARCRAALAESLLAAGRGAEAGVEARTAVAQAIGFPRVRSGALAILASVSLTTSAFASALECTRAALLMEQEHGSERDILLRLVHAQACVHAGDVKAAQATVQEACDRILARAERLSDTRARQSFLRSVQVNSQVLKLAEELGV